MNRMTLFMICALTVGTWSEMSGMTQQSGNEEWAQRIENALNDTALEQSIISICVRNADRETLFEKNAERMLVPASNMKLITTGAALHSLGKDYRFETRIAHDGEIENGTLKGNLYIIGGADPTLGSKDSIATDINRTFAQWTAMLRVAGIRKIDGYVIGDGSWLDGMGEDATWLWNDIGTYYGSGVSGLTFYENMQSFNVSAGNEVGAAVNIEPSYPRADWMEFRYDCTTGKAGTGDRLYMYTSDLAPIAEIRGTFAVDRSKKRVDCSNKFPEYTCAYYFCEYLKKSGIACTKGAADTKLKPVCQPMGEKTELGTTYSPVLNRIVFETNHASNNVYAETLLRALGKELKKSSCCDSSAIALRLVLESLKVDCARGINIQDGSGLSRQNYVSTDFLCRFLIAMMSSPDFDAYLESLPSPGSNGTLSYNMKNYSPEVKSRIKVKSGSMNGVRCYSGYVIPAGNEEVKVFSIMVNNCTAPTWKVRPLLDKIMGLIAE